jgi:uncharacterized protein
VERTLEHFRQVLRREMPALVERYHVASLAIFGSYVRGENTPDSDLDVIVEYSRTPSLFQFVELQDRLSDLLKVPVDLVTKDSLKPYVKVNVLRDLVEV